MSRHPVPDPPPSCPEEMESRYRKIFESAEVGLWEEDYSAVKAELDRLRRDGVSDFPGYLARRPEEASRLAGLIRVLDANSQALKFHGARSLDELGGSLERISVPAALPSFAEALAAIAEGRDHFESEVEGRTLQGQTIYSVIRFSIPAEGADYRRLIVSTVDITKRKLAELAFKDSEERYRSIFENAKVSLWENDLTPLFDAVEQMRRQGVRDCRAYLEQHPALVRDSVGRVVVLDVNRETLRLYKARSKEQFLGTIDRFIFEEALPYWREEIVAIAQGAEYFEGQQKDFNLEGEPMAILVSYAIPRDRDSARRVVISVTDITAHKRVEEEQLKVQRLESLGVLAGGIAHDFNNLLTAILGNISLWKQQLDMGLDATVQGDQLLQETEMAIARARGLTEQLLTFSRGGKPVKKPVALGRLLREAVPFALSGSNVEAEMDLPEDLYDVELDEGQFTQVINNLVINARQAMPSGGRLEIRAANTVSGPPQGPPQGAGQRFVRLEFRDHGPGIPEAELPRIFDPYFTTKAHGKGLGLTVVHSIVRRHDGRIEVQSQPGKGTTFVVHLPASLERAAAVAPGAPPAIKGMRVLVMDDEEPVRTVAARMLEWLGCSVCLAADGEEALALWARSRERGEPLDVLILDLTVPGKMGGEQAIRRLRAQDSQVKAIVSSGYSNDPVISAYRDYGFQGMLTKPYSIKEIQELLAALAGWR